jgi:site-specific recombinase XerD
MTEEKAINMKASAAAVAILGPRVALLKRTGEPGYRRFVEFFTVKIRNAHTRAAYARNASRFLAWLEAHGLAEIGDVEPIHVAAYVEELGRALSAPTVKQHLSTIRELFDWLVTGQVVPVNPAASVRGPRYSVSKGLTPALDGEEARTLLDSIDTSTVIGLRDRALIALLTYTFARVGAAIAMRVEDYYQSGKRFRVRLHEKNGKVIDAACHHNLEHYLDEYIDGAGLRDDDKKGWLFRSARGKTNTLTSGPMHRNDVLRMIQRRAKAAELGASIGCHTFRATGITAYLKNGGRLELAQKMAGHANAKTTSLYDRRDDDISLDEVERIAI